MEVEEEEAAAAHLAHSEAGQCWLKVDRDRFLRSIRKRAAERAKLRGCRLAVLFIYFEGGLFV